MTIGCGTVPAFQHTQFIGEVMLWNMKAVLAGVVMVRNPSRMLMLTDGKLGEAVGEMLGEVVGAFVGVPLGTYVYPVVVGAFVGVAVSRVTTRSVFKPVPVPKPEHSMMEMCVAVIAFQVMEPVAPLEPHLT